jgi:hypothetical protein
MLSNVEHIQVEQGSDEWLQARLGVPSASSFKKLITSTGTKSSTFDDYCYELATEIISGERTGVFVNDAMKRGTELEPVAREMYEFMMDVHVSEYGFLKSETYGCSPDGIIESSAYGLEIKCPLTKTHLKWLDKGKLPAEHKAQVQGCMLVTGLDRWDFYSYNEHFEDLHVIVERDDEYIDKLKTLLAMADKKIKTLTKKGK